MGMLGHQGRGAPAGAAEAPQAPEVDKMAEDIQALEVELNVAELAAEDTGMLMAFNLKFTSIRSGFGAVFSPLQTKIQHGYFNLHLILSLFPLLQPLIVEQN
jgi:hypothetical protein